MAECNVVDIIAVKLLCKPYEVCHKCNFNNFCFFNPMWSWEWNVTDISTMIYSEGE